MIRDGILNINKPAGMTSHDVVNIVRRAAGIILRNLNGEPHVEKTFIDETLILRESFQPSAGSPPAGVSGQYSTG